MPHTQIKYHITKWTNEYVMCETIKDYKWPDSQHELQMTQNQNRTQQNKNNSDKLKIGLNKMRVTLMITIIRMKRCSEVNCCKVMYPCQLKQVFNLEDPRTPYAINTLNIQINLLKTRRRRNCMCRQGIGGHTWPSQVNHPWINQIMYRMMECWTTLSIMPLHLMI